MVDHYQTLEIGRGATRSEMRKAFRRLALKWHPDTNLDNAEEATKKFLTILAAYKALNSPERSSHTFQFQAPNSGSSGDGEAPNFTPTGSSASSTPGPDSSRSTANSAPTGSFSFNFNTNGKTRTTCIRIENGVKTTEIFEDGELISSKKLFVETSGSGNYQDGFQNHVFHISGDNSGVRFYCRNRYYHHRSHCRQRCNCRRRHYHH